MRHDEIRDPIHTFIRFSDDEGKIIDSRPFQRLRDIHQLAMTYMVYPGATHRRFEHSLGVMELASQIFDVVTDDIDDKVLDKFKDELAEKERWRSVLRAAALCHDLGHLPFSHAAEKTLLPQGHEAISARLILEQMTEVFSPEKAEDVAKIALGEEAWKKAMPGKGGFSEWDSVLSEIITSDSFGADRMDYLLRDSHHMGVAYGKFDLGRLVSTIRILPIEQDKDDFRFALGIKRGGLHVAEALLLARYFIYKQVYYHPVRVAYDIHLGEFLAKFFGDKDITADLNAYLDLTDTKILSGLRDCADSESYGRLMQRKHFRCLYEFNPKDQQTAKSEAVQRIYEAAREKFGCDLVRQKSKVPRGAGLPDFWVRLGDNRVVPCEEASAILQWPALSFGFVFIEQSKWEEGAKWLTENRDRILKSKPQG